MLFVFAKPQINKCKETESAYIEAEILGTAKRVENKKRVEFPVFLINTVRQFDYSCLMAIEVSKLSGDMDNLDSGKRQKPFLNLHNPF